MPKLGEIDTIKCPHCKEISMHTWMVRDAVWAEAGLQHDDGHWCLRCFSERLGERTGRRLKLLDFELTPACNELFWLGAELALNEKD